MNDLPAYSLQAIAARAAEFRWVFLGEHLRLAPGVKPSRGTVADLLIRHPLALDFLWINARPPHNKLGPVLPPRPENAEKYRAVIAPNLHRALGVLGDCADVELTLLAMAPDDPHRLALQNQHAMAFQFLDHVLLSALYLQCMQRDSLDLRTLDDGADFFDTYRLAA